MDDLSKRSRALRDLPATVGSVAQKVHRAHRGFPENAGSEALSDSRARPVLAEQWERKARRASRGSGERAIKDHPARKDLAEQKVLRARRVRSGRRVQLAQKGLAVVLARRVQSARWVHKVL